MPPSLCACWNLGRSKTTNRELNSPQNIPNIRSPQINRQPENRLPKQQFCAKPPHPPPPLPKGKLPLKKVSFSRTLDKCCHPSPYEYMDEDENELDGDGYSKVECPPPPPHRFDYPRFLGQKHSTKMGEEKQQPHFASTSQTYSMGSEDPYSSIVSMGEGNRAFGQGDQESSSGIYEAGYSRIKNKRRNWPSNVNGAKNELEEIYAKINGRPSLEPSTSSGTQKDPKMGILPICGQQLMEGGESDSGSLASSSQPSYRYLTVRESARTIWERIRRREEQRAAGGDLIGEEEGGGGGAMANEHFYAEINEYESLGGDNVYGGSMAATSSSNNNGRQLATINHRQNTQNGPLSVDPPPHFIFWPNPISVEPPRPPTSPIPKALPHPPFSQYSPSISIKS